MTTPRSAGHMARLTRQRSRQPGFALIIVLTLMAFLVLLFVTLTISIQVSSQVTQYNLKATQAHLNALYGVRVAMAQLQKFAGPDTRITATADLARRGDGDPSTALPTSTTGSYAYNSTIDTASGLASNAPNANGGTRYWTGVWGNAAPTYSFYGTTGGATPTALPTPTPVLLTWLVSGDENTTLAFTQNATTKQLAIKTPTAAATTFAPSVSISNLTATATALTPLPVTGVTFRGGQANATLLVGSNSAGNQSFSVITINGTAVPQTPVSRYVAAPLVPLTIPGDDDPAPVTTGSYAYWVGDEGVKSKYNMVDIGGNASILPLGYNATATSYLTTTNFGSTQTSFVNSTDTIPKGAAYLNRLIAPQRFALEEMADLSTYPFNNAVLKSMVQPLEGHYIGNSANGSDPIAGTNHLTPTNDPLREHFHDLTTYSLGVLADSQRGGLKYDLTTALEVPAVFTNDLQGKKILPNAGNSTTGNTTGNTTTNPNSPDYGAAVISPLMGPYWDAIQAYYNIGLSSNSTSTATAIPVQPGVVPVVVQGRLEFGMLLDSSEQVDMTLCAGFVLSNPYNFTITASKGLNLTYTINTHTQSEWGFFITPGKGAGGATFTGGFPKSSFEQNGTTFSNAAGHVKTNYYAILPNFVDNSLASSTDSMLGNVTFHLSDLGTAAGSLTLVPGQTKLYAITGSSSTLSLDAQEKNSPLNGNFTWIGQTLPSSGARTIQLGSNATISTSTLNNFVLIQSGGALSSAPTGGSDIFLTTFLPSVACTLQMIAPTGSTSSSGGTTTSPIVLQSIMGLDLTGDGIAGTIPNIPVNIKNNPSGDQGTISDGANSGAIPHHLCTYYFWLGLPASATFYSLGAYNYDNYNVNAGGSSGPSEIGFPTASIGAGGSTLTLNSMPIMDLSAGTYSGSSKTFTGINYRTFTDFNLRATVISLPPSATLNPETQDGYGGLTSNSTIYNGFPNVPPYLRLFDPTAGDNSQPTLVNSDVQFMNNQYFTRNLGNWAGGSNPVIPEWGHANTNLGQVGQPYVTLYNLPWRTPGASAAKTNALPVLSLGQLQHADLTADDLFNSVSYQPGNAFGNSYASPFVGTAKSILSVSNRQQTNLKSLTAAQLGANFTLVGTGAGNATVNAYDMSYLLNAALWDHCYFSGIAQGGGAQGGNYTTSLTAYASLTPNTTTGQVTNPRMRFASGFSPNNTLLNVGAANATIANGVDDLETATASAHNYMPQGYALSRYLMNDGAFNINSTSVEAWKALLASLRALPPASTASALATASAPSTPPNASQPVLAFPRVPASLSLLGNTTVLGNYTYNGTGSNAPNSGDSQQSFTGFRALTDQDISNLATLIVQQVRARGPFLSLSQFVNRRLGPVSDAASQSGALQSAIDALPLAGSTFNAMTDLTASGGGGVNGDNVTFLPSTSYQPIGTMYRSTGIPGWLTQADLLQSLAPVLAARSDTFVIRAYGQVNDPLDGSVVSRAWCEAVVQRLPEYIDTVSINSNNPLREPAAMPDNPAVMPWTANFQNNYFGRRFSLVSLRWLNAGDI